jgi:hypothetical protein
MFKLVNSFTFFLKLLIKNPIFIFSSILSIFYLLVIVFTYSNSVVTNPGNMLQLSTFLVQGAMLFFMFLSYFSINSELSSSSKEMFSTIPLGLIIKLASNLLVITIINIIFCSISLGIFYLAYWFTGFSFSVFYINSIYFIILYWLLPFLISSLIGGFFALFLNRRQSIPILFILWLLISPMNVYFLAPFFSFFGFEGIPDVLIMGLSDPYMSYNAFEGFEISKENFINKVLWVVLIMNLMGATILKMYAKNFHYKRTMFIVLLISFLTISGLAFHDVKYVTYLKDDKQYLDELDYYATYKEAKKDDTHLKYEIQGYKINLKLSSILDASVEITLEERVNKQLTFTLYRGLKISSISDDNDNPIKFKQEGDLVEILLKEPTKKLKFTYKGHSSPYMGVNKDKVFLPFYFPWIPMKSENPPMEYVFDSVHRLPLHDRKNIDYEVFYEGSQELISNLDKVGENHYRGSIKNGITLLSGELESENIGDYLITYPVTWENSMDNIEEYLKYVEKTHKSIKELFGLKTKIPQNIYMVPAVGPNDVLSSEFMWYHPDHLMVLVDSFENHDQNKLLEMRATIPYSLLGAITWKHQGIVYQNNDISILFNSLVGDHINKKQKLEQPEYSEGDFWIENLSRRASNQQIKNLITEVYSFANDEENLKIVESFYQEWYQLLNNSSTSWNDLQKLLSKYKEEKND